MCAGGTLCSDDYLLHTACGLMNLTMSKLYFHGVIVLEHPVIVVVSAISLVFLKFGRHIGKYIGLATPFKFACAMHNFLSVLSPAKCA